MQAKENVGKFKSTWDALFQTVKGEGVMAVYRGLEAQMMRNAVWNATYFATIPFVKRQIAGFSPAKSKQGETGRNFVAGFIAGGLATTLNTPFDVTKTRMQVRTYDSA